MMTLLVAGCGSPSGPPVRDFTEPGWKVESLPPDWSAAQEYVLGMGQEVQWDWVSDDHQILYFEILHNENGQWRNLYGRHLNESVERYMAPRDGAYHFVWINEGWGNVTFHYRMSEGAIHQRYPPNEGPGCGVPMLVC